MIDGLTITVLVFAICAAAIVLFWLFRAGKKSGGAPK